MSRNSWAQIKENKNFNVLIYRRGLMALVFSLGLSCLLVLLIFNRYLARPNPDYYATNGALPPIMLTALPAPNMSSTSLLPPDPPNDERVKVIPQ
ncbi:MAG: phosphoesterase [Legionella sp.]|nr:MAG: phosphoesterase [Legionella sp.]